MNEPTAGYVIFGSGKFEYSIVRHGAGGLHEALAVGARAYDYGSVDILERAGHNLRGACRAAVDKHGQRYLIIDGLDGRAIGALALLQAAAGGEHIGAFRHEEPHNLHGALHQSAAVAGEVEHYLLHGRVLLQLYQRLSHLLVGVAVEGGEGDIAYRAVLHAIVRHGRHLDFLAHYCHRVDAIGHIGALHRHLDGGVGFAFEAGADALGSPRGDGVAVDGDEAVAGAQPGTLGGATLIGRRHIHPALFALHNVGADAAVFARVERFEVVLLALGNILGVGVEVVEHRVDGIAGGLIGVDGIDVVGGKVAHHGVVDGLIASIGRIVEALVGVGRLGGLALGRLAYGREGRDDGRADYQKSVVEFHIIRLRAGTAGFEPTKLRLKIRFSAKTPHKIAAGSPATL